MKLEDAIQISNDILTNKLARHFTKFLVCGSIRRKIENVNDIDVVAIEKNNYEFDEPTLDLTIKKLHNGNDKPMLGDKIKRFSSNEISIDLYLANEATFETLVLIRTGSEDHNYRLATLAKGKGLRLFANGTGLCTFKMEHDKAIPVSIVENTENGILQNLLGRIPTPKQRN